MSNQPPYPVTSVNGKTGAVTISIPQSPQLWLNTYNISGEPSSGSSAVAYIWCFTKQQCSSIDEALQEAGTNEQIWAMAAGGIDSDRTICAAYYDSYRGQIVYITTALYDSVTINVMGTNDFNSTKIF